MTKKFIRKLCLLLTAAVLVTSCPLSTLAIDEEEMVEMAQQEPEQEGILGDETALEAPAADAAGSTAEAEVVQDQPADAADDAEPVIVAETGVGETAQETVQETAQETSQGTDGPAAEGSEDKNAIEKVVDSIVDAIGNIISGGNGSETADAATGANQDAAGADSSAENVIKIDTETSATDAAATAEDAAAGDEATPSELPSMTLTGEPVDGVIVTVSAPEGTFPADAKLVVKKVAENNSDIADIEAAVDNAKLVEAAQGEEPEDADAQKERYTFDIKVEDAQGTVIQPTNEISVKFALADSEKPIADANVYHLEENTTAKTAVQAYALDTALNGDAYSGEETTVELEAYAALDGDIEDDLADAGSKQAAADTDEEEDSEEEAVELKESSLIAMPLETAVNEENAQEVEAETGSFSYYVVEFFYKTYKYVLSGDGEVELGTILTSLDINIDPTTITSVEVSDESLFVASKSEGVWYVKSLKPFSTEEWMKVWVGDVCYEVKVTDETGDVAIIIRNEEIVATYSDLINAVNAAQTGDTVKFLCDISYTGLDGPEIKDNKSITIDFGGYAYYGWMCAGSYALSGGVPTTSDYTSGEVKIVGSEETSQVCFEIMHGSSMTIEGGTFKKNPEAKTKGNRDLVSVITVWNSESDTLIINDGTFVKDSNGKGAQISLNGGCMYINGGTLNGGILFYNNASTVYVQGGTINGGLSDGNTDCSVIFETAGYLYGLNGTIKERIRLGYNTEAFVKLSGISMVGDIYADNSTTVMVTGGIYGDDNVEDSFAITVPQRSNAVIKLSGGKYLDNNNSSFTYDNYRVEGYSAVSLGNNWWLITDTSAGEAKLYETDSSTTPLQTGTLEYMLALATQSNMVKVIATVSQPNMSYTVPSKVTLDINGKDIEAFYINAGAGYLVDTYAGDPGDIRVTGMFVNNDNVYMPICCDGDGKYKTYNLFSYCVATSFGMGKDNPCLRCQYTLEISKSALELLTHSNSGGVKLTGCVSWYNADKQLISYEIAFTDELIQEYGSLDTEKAPVFYLSLSGIESMCESNRIVKTTPVFKVTGVTGSFLNTGNDDKTLITKYAKLATKSDAPYYTAYYSTEGAYNAQSK